MGNTLVVPCHLLDNKSLWPHLCPSSQVHMKIVSVPCSHDFIKVLGEDKLGPAKIPLFLAGHSLCSGCLACRNKHTLNTADEPPVVPSVHNLPVRKLSLSEDFWTTSTREMDISAAQSQGSISSISTSNQFLDPHGVAGNHNNTAEFVNHGLLLWNQTRQHWIKSKKPESGSQQIKEPKLSWNATYESLLGSNKPFHQPIPLGEMVDFLVDIWEQEGMYD